MNTMTPASASIAERLQLCLPNRPLIQNPNARVAELGLDSMDTVELLCVVHEEFGVRLTEADFYPTQTVDGLLRAIARLTNPQPPKP
jgi:acyl carrier protein